MTEQAQLVFSCLAIGNLGEAGRVSLNSVLKLGHSVMYALADSHGLNWLNDYLKVNPQFREKVFISLIPEEFKETLEVLDTSNNYVSFGNPKFFRLMYLKWTVLLRAISEFPKSDFVIFTDLDVLWIKDPRELLNSFLASDACFAIQEDYGRNRESFACPGIMVWRTSSSAIRTLKDLDNYHRDLLEIDPLTPDDKALNAWIKQPENSQKTLYLERKFFVIGHRLLSLLLGLEGMRINYISAFHANYTVGADSKLASFKVLVRSQNRLLFRLYYVIIFSIRLIVRKLLNLFH